MQERQPFRRDIGQERFLAGRAWPAAPLRSGLDRRLWRVGPIVLTVIGAMATLMADSVLQRVRAPSWRRLYGLILNELTARACGGLFSRLQGKVATSACRAPAGQSIQTCPPAWCGRERSVTMGFMIDPRQFSQRSPHCHLSPRSGHVTDCSAPGAIGDRMGQPLSPASHNRRPAGFLRPSGPKRQLGAAPQNRVVASSMGHHVAIMKESGN